MRDRAHQVGVNEALFRAVNEQIETLNKQLRGPGGMQVVCECGDGRCVDRVSVSVDDYERVRKDPRRFIVVPGHEIPDLEAVLEEHGSFLIIEKIHPEPERIAEETDPRS